MRLECSYVTAVQLSLELGILIYCCAFKQSIRANGQVYLLYQM